MEKTRDKLKDWEGFISDIPNSHTGIIKFELKGRKLDAFFFVASFYCGGDKLTPRDILSKHVKIGDKVFFDAAPNLRENSFNIKWKAVAVWKGNRPKCIPSETVLQNFNGIILDVSDQDGLIIFSLNGGKEKCLFNLHAVDVENNTFTGCSLKNFLAPNDLVLFTAHFKLGKRNNVLVKWEADKVWKEHLCFMNIEEFNDMMMNKEGDWHCVEGRKGNLQKKKFQDVKQIDVQRHSNKKNTFQQTVEKHLGIVVDVNARRAVLTFFNEGNKERALLLQDKFQPSVTSLLNVLNIGDRVQFECHLYDKPDKSDKCKWFVLDAHKVTSSEKEISNPFESNSFENVTELTNKCGIISHINHSSGIILYNIQGKNLERINFHSSSFICNEIADSNNSNKELNLNLYLAVGDDIFFDAMYIPEKLQFEATKVWKGEKYRSYQAALKNGGKRRAISESSEIVKNSVDNSKTKFDTEMKIQSPKSKVEKEQNSISSVNIPQHLQCLFYSPPPSPPLTHDLIYTQNYANSSKSYNPVQNFMNENILSVNSFNNVDKCIGPETNNSKNIDNATCLPYLENYIPDHCSVFQLVMDVKKQLMDKEMPLTESMFFPSNISNTPGSQLKSLPNFITLHQSLGHSKEKYNLSDLNLAYDSIPKQDLYLYFMKLEEIVELQSNIILSLLKFLPNNSIIQNELWPIKNDSSLVNTNVNNKNPLLNNSFMTDMPNISSHSNIINMQKSRAETSIDENVMSNFSSANYSNDILLPQNRGNTEAALRKLVESAWMSHIIEQDKVLDFSSSKIPTVNIQSEELNNVCDSESSQIDSSNINEIIVNSLLNDEAGLQR